MSRRTIKRTDKPQVSIAMSQQDGCIVIIGGINDDTKVLGSLDRDATIAFCDACLRWMPCDLNIPDAPAMMIVETLN